MPTQPDWFVTRSGNVLPANEDAARTLLPDLPRFPAPVIRPLEDSEGFLATLPALPGTTGIGPTPEAAARELRISAGMVMAILLDEAFGYPLGQAEDEARTVEHLAALAHEQWSGWEAYMFTKCDIRPDGTAVMPEWAVTRWTRQMTTPYEQLPEEEKESDRKEARRVIAVLRGLGLL